MKRKILIVVAILAVTCWASAAMAFPIFTDPNPFNSTFTQTDTSLTGPFATLNITLASATEAEFTITASGSFLFSDVFLNLANTAVTTTVETFNGGGTYTPAIHNGNVGGFGKFNYELNDSPTGLAGAGTSLTFDLSLTSGTWTSGSSVLTGNAGGGQGPSFSDAFHVFNSDGSITGFAGEAAAVPIPPTALLLGSGLLGLVGLGWRGKK